MTDRLSEAALDLSPTMSEALASMRANGGLKRLPGGFWIPATLNTPHEAGWYGTTTVAALVSRNVATYTEWKGDGPTKFPIMVEVANG